MGKNILIIFKNNIYGGNMCKHDG